MSHVPTDRTPYFPVFPATCNCFSRFCTWILDMQEGRYADRRALTSNVSAVSGKPTNKSTEQKFCVTLCYAWSAGWPLHERRQHNGKRIINIQRCVDAECKWSLQRVIYKTVTSFPKVKKKCCASLPAQHN